MPLPTLHLGKVIISTYNNLDERNNYILIHAKLHTSSDCCNKIEVVGKGRVLERASSSIFSIYTYTGLKNGKVHYMSQDGGRTLEFDTCRGGMWKITYPGYGSCAYSAYTETVNTCPNESGHTWRYWDKDTGSFREAGEDLEVRCANEPST